MSTALIVSSFCEAMKRFLIFMSNAEYWLLNTTLVQSCQKTWLWQKVSNKNNCMASSTWDASFTAFFSVHSVRKMHKCLNMFSMTTSLLFFTLRWLLLVKYHWIRTRVLSLFSKQPQHTSLCSINSWPSLQRRPLMPCPVIASRWIDQSLERVTSDESMIARKRMIYILLKASFRFLSLTFLGSATSHWSQLR